jgi:hypothetical protein
MSYKYIPAVGHMVRKAHWGDVDELEVTAVGRFEFLTLTLNGRDEQSWKLASEWVQVVKPEPLTETWVCVSTQGVESLHNDRSANDAATAVEKCEWVWFAQPVAVVHIWTDAEGADHAEVERVTK